MTDVASDHKTKGPWESKTLWLAALTALVPLASPAAGAWVAGNPELFSAGVGMAFAALRLISKGRISVS